MTKNTPPTPHTINGLTEAEALQYGTEFIAQSAVFREKVLPLVIKKIADSRQQVAGRTPNETVFTREDLHRFGCMSIEHLFNGMLVQQRVRAAFTEQKQRDPKPHDIEQEIYPTG